MGKRRRPDSFELRGLAYEEQYYEILKKCKAVAAKVGVALDFTRDPSDDGYIAFNGTSIGCLSRSLSNIIHDIAHYQCASKGRRSIPDFGLGASPDTQILTPNKVARKVAIQEEELASLLGIAYEAAFGMPFIDTLNYHGWIVDSFYRKQLPKCPSSDFIKTIAALQKKGLLVDVVPATLLDERKK